MTKPTNIVIDHIDHVEIDIRNSPVNNLHIVNYLPQGLFLLAFNVGKEEEKEAGVALRYGSATPFIVPCMFHWFSISIVNYARFVGLLSIMKTNGWTQEDISKNKVPIKQACSDYVEKVVPSIQKWRNKVSAHFAASDPYPDDNMGTIEESLINSIGIINGRYKAGAMQPTIKGESSQLPAWSVTQTFEDLAPRLWPRASINTRSPVPPETYDLSV